MSIVTLKKHQGPYEIFTQEKYRELLTCYRRSSLVSHAEYIWTTQPETGVPVSTTPSTLAILY